MCPDVFTARSIDLLPSLRSGEGQRCTAHKACLVAKKSVVAAPNKL